MKKLRLYTDTSVIGGYFDEGFAKDSRRLIQAAISQRAILLLSDLVLDELEGAPEKVRRVLDMVPASSLEMMPLTAEVKSLRDAYLKAGILTTSSQNDAAHVAMATIGMADAIVSWNFKHIVQLGKMKAYNKVNLKNGYGYLNIVTPKEVEI